MWTNSNLETVIDALNEMIPMQGSVPNINKNRCLERFRTAQNVVYDIFNMICNIMDEDIRKKMDELNEKAKSDFK